MPFNDWITDTVMNAQSGFDAIAQKFFVHVGTSAIEKEKTKSKILYSKDQDFEPIKKEMTKDELLMFNYLEKIYIEKRIPFNFVDRVSKYNKVFVNNYSEVGGLKCRLINSSKYNIIFHIKTK